MKHVLKKSRISFSNSETIQLHKDAGATEVAQTLGELGLMYPQDSGRRSVARGQDVDVEPLAVVAHLRTLETIRLEKRDRFFRH